MSGHEESLTERRARRDQQVHGDRTRQLEVARLLQAYRDGEDESRVRGELGALLNLPEDRLLLCRNPDGTVDLGLMEENAV